MKKWLTIISASALALTLSQSQVKGAITEKGNQLNPCLTSGSDSDGNSDSSDSSGDTGSNSSGDKEGKDVHTDVDVKFDDNSVPLGRAKVKKLAKATAKAGEKIHGFKIDPGLIYAQWVQESGQDFYSNPSLNGGAHNLGGLSSGGGVPDWLAKKGVKVGSTHAEGDGKYYSFPSYKVFAEAYISGHYPAVPKALKAGTKSGKGDADITAFAKVLRDFKYYTASVAEYTPGVKGGYASYYNATDVADDITTATDTPEEDNMTNCDTSKSENNVNSSKLEELAKSMVGYFKGHYRNVHGAKYVSDKGDDEDWSASDINKDGYTDCSGFVWLIMKVAGYKVPKEMGWDTGSMATDAHGKHAYLKAIDKDDAKAGTIVTHGGAGANGHTIILAEDWHGDNTMVYSMGSNKGVEKIEYHYVMSDNGHPADKATFAVPAHKK